VLLNFNEGVRHSSWLNTITSAGMPAEEAAKVLSGLRLLSQTAESPDARVEHRMMPGDMMCFDNRRVMHGRTSFRAPAEAVSQTVSGSADRHLQGTYLNLDEIEGRLRFLKATTG
jgi:gamma-butyrobetaine dioxygenase